jgi:hypothetical protein
MDNTNLRDGVPVVSPEDMREALVWLSAHAHVTAERLHGGVSAALRVLASELEGRARVMGAGYQLPVSGVG